MLFRSASGLVGLKGRHYDIEQPEQAQEDHGSQSTISGATELSTDSDSSDEQEYEAKDGADDEYDHGETQAAGWHVVAIAAL